MVFRLVDGDQRTGHVASHILFGGVFLGMGEQRQKLGGAPAPKVPRGYVPRCL